MNSLFPGSCSKGGASQSALITRSQRGGCPRKWTSWTSVSTHWIPPVRCETSRQPLHQELPPSEHQVPWGPTHQAAHGFPWSSHYSCLAPEGRLPCSPPNCHARKAILMLQVSPTAPYLTAMILPQECLKRGELIGITDKVIYCINITTILSFHFMEGKRLKTWLELWP